VFNCDVQDALLFLQQVWMDEKLATILLFEIQSSAFVLFNL